MIQTGDYDQTRSEEHLCDIEIGLIIFAWFAQHVPFLAAISTEHQTGIIAQQKNSIRILIINRDGVDGAGG